MEGGLVTESKGCNAGGSRPKEGVKRPVKKRKECRLKGSHGGGLECLTDALRPFTNCRKWITNSGVNTRRKSYCLRYGSLLRRNM